MHPGWTLDRKWVPHGQEVDPRMDRKWKSVWRGAVSNNGQVVVPDEQEVGLRGTENGFLKDRK